MCGSARPRVQNADCVLHPYGWSASDPASHGGVMGCTGRAVMLAKAKSPFFEAHKAVAADYHVVEHGDVEQLAGLD